MSKSNKGYYILSALAIGGLVFSYFQYENKLKKATEGLESYLLTTEKKPTEESTAASSTSEAETKTSEEVNEQEEQKTPQTMKEPLTVNGIVVVNKRYPLPESYDPGVSEEALAAFKSMNEEMRNLGLDISAEFSGYRSYKEQETLFKDYANDDGVTEAEQYSSRPGYSEHQTGLAFDFINGAGELVTAEPEANWIAENAHRYGFIVRYQKDKEEVTGYMAEAWHVRYVGTEPATEIYEKNQTLEEYLEVEGGGYDGEV